VKFVDLHFENYESSMHVHKDYEAITLAGKYLLGDMLKLFETEFAHDQNVKHVIGVKNATDALYMIFKLLHAENRTLILPQFGAYPTVMAAIQAGACNIIAAPIDNRLTLDLSEIDVPRGSIIVPVHLFGNHAEMSHIEEIAKSTESIIIEDFAQATGLSKSKNSIAAVHSFYPTKPMGCRGDGGAILTDDSNLWEKCMAARFYGLDSKGEISSWGFNSRMDEWQASFLLQKMKCYRTYNEIRRKNAGILSSVLEPSFHYTDDCVYHQYVTLWHDREIVREILLDNKVPTMVHYPKMLSDMPYLSSRVKFANCKNVSKHVLSIPVGPHLNDADLELLTESISRMSSMRLKFEEIK